MKHIVFIILVGFITNSCNWFGNVEEGDRNTYTWKGKIFDGFSDSPLKNTRVYLEAAYDRFESDEFEVIGEAITDSDGNYSITYKRIRSASAYSISLYSENESLSNMPMWTGHVNTSYNLILATIRHSRLYIDINTSSSLLDTLIIAPNGLQAGENTIGLNINGGGIRPYVIVLPEGKPDIIGIKTQAIALNEDGTIRQGIRYGIGRKDLIKAANAGFIDSIPDDYNELWYDLKGFPEYDTVSLNI